ncbi:alpha/beta hydrolase [Mycobacterium talmoniae]|uniref:alpha/beta hydrolase n=1 Tax=Mycobacterium talmoniae TaxID=1858794 RepID=UPI0009F3237C|nr:alpha/beta hydrolase [Mycobacterium talmoniae]
MLPTHTGVLTADDGTPLAWQVWDPDNPPRASIVFLHGGAEYGRRYPRLITALVSCGWAVVAPDLRGHGRSGGRRGGLKRFSDYLDDLALILDLARRRGGGVPLFLVGYSLGGLISASYSLTRVADGELAGLVLIAPALGPATKRRLQCSVLRALCR